MKGDRIQIGERIGQIIRIVLNSETKTTTVRFFDYSIKKIDLNDYVWDDEKKVWKK